MDYLIISTAVVDQIYYPNKKHSMLSIGGAGFYAYCGARIWSHSTSLSCGKGLDFEKTLHPYFLQDHISDKTMFDVNLPTPRTKVKYDTYGERVETPVYGKEHYQKFVSDISEIEKYCKSVKGIYIFKEAEDKIFWNELIELKKKYNFKIIWEISSDSTKPSNFEFIKSISKNIDIFSINKSEAINLFECKDTLCDDMFQQFDFDLVFFRKGSKGASMITKKDNLFIPSVDTFDLVDPTGAGNSSTAAVLVGYCENKGLAEIGLMGSISAGFIISQYGAPLTSSVETNVKAKNLLKIQLKKVKCVR